MMFLYSIKDVKVGFMSPVMRDNDDIIKRDYNNMLNAKQENFLNLNPSDYELWKVAEINLKTGEVIPCLEFIM